MIRALHLLLPLVLTTYFVVRARSSRVFLLGIPMMMFMAFTVFFTELKPFWVPGRLSMNTHIMLWLTIVWVLCTGQVPLRPGRRREKRPFGPPLTMPEEAAVVAIFVLTVIAIALTGARYNDMMTALTSAQPLLYLVAGYFMVRGIVSHSSREDVMRFIKALVVINTIACVLYIVHQGLHVSLYNGSEYKVIVVNGQRLTRSFYFMPQLLMLSVAWCLVQRRWNLWIYLILLLNLVAIWISYTRSSVFIVVAMALLVVVMRLIRRREGSIGVRRLLSVVAVVAVVAVTAIVVFPTETSYFFERFREAQQGQGTDKNLNIRRIKVERTYEWTKETNAVLGVGFPTSSQHPYYSSMEVMASDIIWVPVLFYLGITGVIAFGALYALFGLRLAALLRRARGPQADLWLLWLVVVLASFAEGFVGWTLFNDRRYPLGMWFFAVIAAEIVRERSRPALPAAQESEGAAEPHGEAAALTTAGGAA